MVFRNFWYSYKSILINTLEKNFFQFLKKIFGVLYKFIVRFFKHQLSFGVTNLDSFEKNFFQLSLDKLFQKFKDTICTLKSSAWITWGKQCLYDGRSGDRSTEKILDAFSAYKWNVSMFGSRKTSQCLGRGEKRLQIQGMSSMSTGF